MVEFRNFDLAKAYGDAARIKGQRTRNAMADFTLGQTRDFNAMAGDIAAGDPEAMRQGMATDPERALSVGKAGSEAENERMRRMGRMAKFVLDHPPEQRAAAWQKVRPQAPGIFGVPASQIPEEYDEGQLQAIYSNVAKGGGKPQSPLGKLRTDLEAGLITPDQYKAAVAKANAPRGSGITINTGEPTIGRVPPGYQAVQGPDGAWSMEQIPGGPAAEKTEKKAGEAEIKQILKETQFGVVAEDIDRSITMIEGATIPITGIGSVLSSVPGTAAHDLSKLIDTIKANVGFDKLQAMREASPTGGALGQVSEMENKLLQSVLGSLAQSQSKEELIYNLRRVKDLSNDIVNVGTYGPSKKQGNEFSGISDDDFALVPLTGDNAAAWMEEAKRRGLVQ